MDEYEQYLADVEYEDYLKGIQQEDAQKTVNRYSQPSPMGPDYDQGFLANAGKSILEFPESMLNFAGDVYNFASDPIGAFKRAGVEGTAKTVGGLGAGTAGAATGAAFGSALGPVGAVVGGGLGFGAGMLGFDLGADAASDLATGTEQYTRPYDQYLKDMVYNSTQGVVGGALTEGAGALTRKGRSYFSPDRAQIRAAEDIQRLAPEVTPEKIDQMYLQNADNPLYQNRSLGEMFDSDTLKNSQRTIAKSGIEQYGRSAEMARMRDNARFQYMDDLEQSPITVDDIQSETRAAIENKLASGQAGLSEAEQAVVSGIDDLRPGIDPSEAGAQMRTGAEGFKEGLKSKQRTEFGKLTADDIPINNVAAAAIEAKDKYFKKVGVQPDSGVMELIKDLTERSPELITTADGKPLTDLDGNPYQRPPKYSLLEIQQMRSTALDIANSGGRDAGVAGAIADALKKAGDDAVKSGKLPQAEIDAWNEGIRLRKEQGTKLESSAVPAKAVLAKQPYGEYRLAESAIPSKFFRKGEKGVREGLRNYREVVGATQEAMEPLYRYATDRFREYAVKEGNKINRKGYERFMKDYKAAMDDMPELRQQFSTLDKAQEFVDSKFADVERTRADIEKGAFKYFIDAEPEVAIAKMLSGQDVIKRTKATADYLRRNDPDALKGLGRGIVEYMQKKAYIPDSTVTLEAARTGEPFKGTVQRGVLKKEWERIRPAVEKAKIYTDSQLKGFDLLYKDLSSEISIGKAVIKDGSDTFQNLSAMASLYKMGRTGFLKTVPGGKYLQMIEPILQAIPQARYLEAFEEALLNPRFARDILVKANEKNISRAAEMVFSREISAALGTAPLVTGKEEPKKPVPPPKQSSVTSTQSFPRPERLLSPETSARMKVESSNNPYAVSPKGAEGLNQIMPETGKWIASKLGETYKPLRADMSPQEKKASIEQNVRFSEWYMDYLLGRYKKYPNRTTLARAAYNAGEGRIDQALRKAGNPNDTGSVLRALPRGVKRETIPYVQRISEVIERYQ